MYPLKTENTFLLREIFVFFSKVNLGYILRVNYTCLATTGSLKAMPRCPLPPHFIPEPPLPRCLVSSLFSPLPLFHFSTFSFRKHKRVVLFWPQGWAEDASITFLAAIGLEKNSNLTCCTFTFSVATWLTNGWIS